MELNKYIDHTLLSPDATEAQVDTVIKQAIDNLMINPYWVAKTHQALEGTDVVTATVIGFPLGATTTAAKVF